MIGNKDGTGSSYPVDAEGKVIAIAIVAVVVEPVEPQELLDIVGAVVLIH